ncbi:MAG: helix-turn-helix transcriptional regulator [Myxococcaceae bacterium]
MTRQGEGVTQAISAFGRQLKQWRRQRGVSQLALAERAQVSQRHISFIETGRSRPGEETVHRIAEALEIPLRERNSMLEAAGLSAMYPEHRMSDSALAPFRQAVARMLEAHEPYPAFVINRWWDVVEVNKAASRFLPLSPGASTNFLEVFFSPGPYRELIVNYPAVAWAALRRVRTEAAHFGSDERLSRLLTRAERSLADVPEGAESREGDLVVCPHLRWGERVIKTISIVARFGNTREVTLDELRVELMLPQDKAAADFFLELASLRRDV